MTTESDTGGNFPRMLQILRSDGSTVQDFRSAPDWRLLKDGQSDATRPDASPIDVISFTAEEHHRYYGRPWILGRYYVNELIARGIRPSDRVLDIGCGAGRVGIWLIPHLYARGYHGVDSHLRSLVAFAGYESFMHQLWLKQPRLMWSDQFEVEGFGAVFDVVLDFFVTAHLPLDRTAAAFSRIARRCGPGARLYTLQAPRLGLDRMRTLGFDLLERQQVRYELFSDHEDARFRQDEWHVFRRV